MYVCIYCSDNPWMPEWLNAPTLQRLNTPRPRYIDGSAFQPPHPFESKILTINPFVVSSEAWASRASLKWFFLEFLVVHESEGGVVYIVICYLSILFKAQQLKMQQTSLGLSVFNLCNEMLGSGVFALPSAMKNSGVVLFRFVELQLSYIATSWTVNQITDLFDF